MGVDVGIMFKQFIDDRPNVHNDDNVSSLFGQESWFGQTLSFGLKNTIIQFPTITVEHIVVSQIV